MSIEAAVMVVYDSETKKVLSEERTRPDKAYFGQRIFLSGRIEPEERNDPSVTVKRELREELGIEVIDVFPLSPEGPVAGDVGEQLYPYIITQWNGEIPEKVIDSNNPLVWDTLAEATTSPVASRILIAKLAIEYLSQAE